MKRRHRIHLFVLRHSCSFSGWRLPWLHMPLGVAPPTPEQIVKAVTQGAMKPFLKSANLAVRS